MSKMWDNTLKRLFAVIVAWLMPGAVLLADVPLELKFRTRTRHADALYKVLIDGEEALIHIEFQKRADPTMAERIWEYNVLATLAHSCPVYSFVIYLRPTSTIPESPLEWGLPLILSRHTDYISAQQIRPDRSTTWTPPFY